MAKKGAAPLGQLVGDLRKFGQGVGEKVRGNPNTTMVSLTAAGQSKARQYAVEGKKGDILTYVNRAQLASMREISEATGIDMRTVQNIIHEFAASKPPLAVIGGQ